MSFVFLESWANKTEARNGEQRESDFCLFSNETGKIIIYPRHGFLAKLPLL